MTEEINIFISENEKKTFIEELTPQLTLLRTKAGISQDELSNLIGISRQTYGAIERRMRQMSWNTYLSLILFYDYNTKTHDVLRSMSIFPHELIKRFNFNTVFEKSEKKALFNEDISEILGTLDERAISTLKTVLMVEYSRCNKVSGDAVVKFFEGIDLVPRSENRNEHLVTKALKNIRRKNGNE